MVRKYALLIFILVITIFSVYQIDSTYRDEKAQKDGLRFSNTSVWSPYYLSFAEGVTRYPAELFIDITLPPPPENSSAQVREEIATLKSFKYLRTLKELEDFTAEGDRKTLYFGGYTLAQYTDPKFFPATAALIIDSFHDTEVIEMQQKKIFDRVRPSVLDPSLDTMVQVHGHPAYPSYRSTEMHFLAYVFSELAPLRREEFITRAYAIAFNCQIAGLQYPSDTAAGVVLAKQIFSSFMKSDKFNSLLEAARKEWIEKGLTQT